MDACIIATILALMLSALKGQGSGDDSWPIKVQPEVRAREGYPVVLPCSFSHPHHTSHSSLLVAWRLGHGRGSTTLYSCTTNAGSHACEPGPHQDPRYRLEGNPREHDLSLRINSAALQDSGRYYCRVEVPGHKHASYEDKMGTRLRVEAPPRILSVSVEGSEAAGYSALCEVMGSPLPDVQWVSPPFQLLEVGPPEQDSPSANHAVSRLAVVHAGHQYTCSASNPLGQERADLYVLPPRPEGSRPTPPLLLLLSLALGAKALLLGVLGVWMVQGRAAKHSVSCGWK